MEFWRGEAYTAYVDYLESTGGFYYEVKPAFKVLSKQILTVTPRIPFDRDGVMHQYTPWRSPSSSRKIKSTSSIKSDTPTSPTRIVRRIWGLRARIVVAR